MDFKNLAERAFHGNENNLANLSILLRDFGSMDVSKYGEGEKILKDIKVRILKLKSTDDNSTDSKQNL
jgi:hypothetical protein